MKPKTEKSEHELFTLQVNIEEEEEELEEGELNEYALTYPSYITSQICLKRMDPSEKMNRDVIIRRIRHHKRVKKVKNVLEALFISPFSTTTPTNLKDRVSGTD